METKYHINPETQRPNVCRVKLENCSVSTNNSDHYPDKETAREALEAAVSTDDTLSYKVEDVVDKEALKEVVDTVEKDAEEKKESVKETVEEVKESFSEKKEEVKEKAEEVKNDVSEKAAEKKVEIREEQEKAIIGKRIKVSKVFSFISKYSGKIAKKISPK